MSKMHSDSLQNSVETGTGKYEFVLTKDPVIASSPFITKGLEAIRDKVLPQHPEMSTCLNAPIDPERLRNDSLLLVTAFDKTDLTPVGFYTASAFKNDEVEALRIEDAYAESSACGIVGEAIADMERLARAYDLSWVYLQTARRGWSAVAVRYGYTAIEGGIFRRQLWQAAAKNPARVSKK